MITGSSSLVMLLLQTEILECNGKECSFRSKSSTTDSSIATNNNEIQLIWFKRHSTRQLLDSIRDRWITAVWFQAEQIVFSWRDLCVVVLSVAPEHWLSTWSVKFFRLIPVCWQREHFTQSRSSLRSTVRSVIRLDGSWVMSCRHEGHDVRSSHRVSIQS